MQPLARQLRWVIALRLVVITSVVLPYFLLATFTGPPPEPVVAAPEGVPPPPIASRPPVEQPAAPPAPVVRPVILYRLAGLTYLASLVYIVLLRLLARREAVQAHVQFFGDVVLVTALVYVTGGLTSPFSLFYLVIVAVASTLLTRQAGFTVATVAYAAYASLLLGLYFGWLPAPEVGAGSGDRLFRLLYNLAVNFLAFYAVAVLTSMLAGRATRAERELEAKREDLADLQVQHRDVIQSISSGLATTDVEGRVTSLNRAGEDILRRAEAEVVGGPFHEIVGRGRWEEVLAGRPTAGGLVRSEVEVAAAGGPVHLGFSVSPLIDAAGTHRGYNVIFQDLTAWHRMEEELRMKDRMAAVGELAAGIAHEIGNPLAAISGSVQMLASTTAGEGERQKLLAILLKESQRLDRTIKGFLRFARPRDRSTAEFDAAALLAENVELLRNSEEVGPRHRIELELDPPSVPLVADRDQVSQVFWNVARNALKAMPDGGTLRVRGEVDGGTYRMRFRDTGRGMPESQRANLFHPFQSFFDSGSGIGMAIVYRIVQEHGGRVGVRSAEGAGTTITVELPLAGRPAAPAAATAASAPAAEPAAEPGAAAGGPPAAAAAGPGAAGSA